MYNQNKIKEILKCKYSEGDNNRSTTCLKYIDLQVKGKMSVN